MIAGTLCYRLVLLRPATLTSPSGEVRAAEWQPWRTVRAERVRLSGRGSQQAGEQFADYTAQWRIRDAHAAVRPGWRVQQPDEPDVVFSVVAVEPNRRRGFLTLICERLNT